MDSLLRFWLKETFITIRGEEMRLRLSIILLFSVGIFSAAAECRVWKDRKGHSIEAEYKGMDGNKAILIRMDGRKFLIDPLSLSAEDQNYLKRIASNLDSDTESSNATAEMRNVFISIGEAKAIAQKYVEALGERDYETYKSLLLNPGDLSADIFQWQLQPLNLKRVNLKEVVSRDNGYDARYEVVGEWTFDETGEKTETAQPLWIQIVPDGRIKYDDIFIRHPVKIAMESLSSAIYYARNREPYPNAEELMNCGVPLFGYKVDTNESDQINSLKKLRDWLFDEGRKWDATEPKVVPPKDAYKSWKNNLQVLLNQPGRAL